MKKRLLIDGVIFGLQKVGGISRYWADLILALDTSDQYEILLLLPKTSNVEWQRIQPLLRATILIPRKRFRWGKRSFWRESLYLSWLALRYKPAIWHSSYYVGYPLLRNIQRVVTYCDMIPEALGEGNAYDSHMKLKTLQESDTIISISEHSLRDLHQFVPGLQAVTKVVHLSAPPRAGPFDEPRPKGQGVYLGGVSTPPKFGSELPGPKGPGFGSLDENNLIEPFPWEMAVLPCFGNPNRGCLHRAPCPFLERTVLSSYFHQKALPPRATEAAISVPHPYFLFIGRRDSYKNFVALLPQLLAEPKLQDYHIVVMGGNAQWTQQEAAIIAQFCAQDRVHNQGTLAASLIASWIKHSEALLYPSLYEGFGLPLLESFQHAVPVLACRTSSIPEVTGDDYPLADPKDPQTFIPTLLSLLENKAHWVAYGKERLKHFTLDRMVIETLSLYQ